MRIFFILLLIFAGLILAEPSFAGNGGGETSVPSSCKNDAGGDSFYTTKVVHCIQDSIMKASYNFLESFTEVMRPVTMAFITLVVAFFGVRVANGEGRIAPKAFILLIKIGAVWMFADNLGGYAPDIFSIMSDMQSLIVNSLDTGSFSCTSSGGGGFTNAAGGDLIWHRMDCITGKMFGFGAGLTISNSILGLLTGAAFSGTFGGYLFVTGLATLFAIILFTFRAVYSYLTAYIFAAFLIAISPLIIPLLLLNVTSGIFNKWYGHLIASITMPMIVFAYLGIALPLLDDAMFADNGKSIKSILGDDYSKYYRGEEQLCSWQIATDPNFYKKMEKGDFDYVNGALANKLAPTQSGSSDICALTDVPSIDFGAKHNSVILSLVKAMFTLWITAWLVSTLMVIINEMAAGLFQGGAALTALSSGEMLFEKQGRGMLNKAQKSARESFAGKTAPRPDLINKAGK